MEKGRVTMTEDTQRVTSSAQHQFPWALQPETILVEGGRPERTAGSPMNLPLYPATNFRSAHDGKSPRLTPDVHAEADPRRYARTDGTPSWAAFESVVGALEGGVATAFSSGMAAIAAVLELVPVGGRVLLSRDRYMGTQHLLEDGHEISRWQLQTVDLMEPDSFTDALHGASMLWIETPSNPLLEVCDLPTLVTRAHAAGALVVVDNTFATPLRQTPLAIGADVVVHSATKFMGGHADLLMGVTVTADRHTHDRLVRRRALAGATPGALESFLALRGLRTMAVRLAAAENSAAELARRLTDHPAVTKVHYPGLPDDPHHAQAAKQMTGFGAVLSFEVADAATADSVCDAVQIIEFATSLGGVESTIERRAKHAGEGHVPAGLLRLSVGCEHVEDLWQDLHRAIEASRPLPAVDQGPSQQPSPQHVH
jgi:cystathionine gamma-synthase